MTPLADAPQGPPGERTAIVHEGERFSFADLDRRSAAWAATLVRRGVASDALVAIALPNGFEFLAATFGVYRAGATPAPMSHRLPAGERQAILELMAPAAVIDAGAEPDGDAPPAPAPPHIAASWKACTSGGSTGRPKIIVDARPAAFAPETEFIAIPAAEPVLVPGPLYHNAPFSAAVFALSRGCTVVTAERFDAAAALDLIERERVTWAMMVPTMLHRIMALPAAARDDRDLSSWRTVVHTAAPMAAWLKRAWIDWRGPDHIWEVYGATEGIVRCWIGGAEWLERPGSVGRPIGGATLRILDEAGRDVPAGTVGEVFAMPPGGPRSTYRYIGADRRATPDGWESVGDCGRLDAEGYLYLTDRRSDLIITGGINVWPAEVEAALLRHPDVRSCAVFGEPDEELGQRVHAVVESGRTLTLEALAPFLTGELSRPKWPRALTVREATVRDDAGKFRKPRS